ncbi:sensor domain-containing protein [Aeromicrobium stalagmiti]|uniref:sensor domain-containing protein n=1 Tax=Aeromicrobium stalagmiti TaxID=2738988 RepID=UPI00156963B8|nr:EAL domain-containing protein [Aeromicrobium stalagmiti]NRQ49632.1 EAL domain-containing protein [Aeromicrobium stalagmiti]
MSRQSASTTWNAVPGRPSLRDAAPFVAVAVLGLGSVLLPPYNRNGGEPLLVVALFVVALGFVWVSTHRDHRSWVDPAGPLVFLVVLALARDISGGTTSGLAPLTALPIMWVAITGTRRDLAAVGALTATIFLLPILLVGAPDYPVSDWRRALLWTAFAAFVAPVVQRMVRQLAAETMKEKAASAELEGIMRGARLSSMISTDAAGIIRSFSSGAEALLGYGADDLVGVETPQVFHDAAEIVTVADELGVEPGFSVFSELARRHAPSRIWTYVRGDGRRIFVRLVVTELLTADGLVTGYLGVAIDATENVESQRALALAEARWRVLMDHLPELTVVMLDEDLTISVVAGAGAMRQGLEGAVGKHLSAVSNPHNFEILSGLVLDAIDGKDGVAELPSSRTGDEHEVFVTPLPSEGGRGRALILARDVSRDRERERVIVEAKERAERLFTDAPHGIAVLAPSGTFLQANAALLAMTGHDETRLLGSNVLDLAVPVDDRLQRHLSDARSRPGQRVESECEIHGPHGSLLHVSVSSRVLTTGGEDIVITNVVDISERYRYERRLAHLADHDALTGLVNRRRFGDELQRHLDHCSRYGAEGAVLLLDLDHFKEVNDTLGHNAGDELIVSTAALLLSGVRGSDVVARLGGDEFAILLTKSNQADASAVARSIVKRVREHTRTLDGTRRRVTASVGVATVLAARDHGGDILALADLMMYDAKDAGRDGFAVLEESGGRKPRTGARLEWKGRIERALENDDLTLHLQPIMDLQTDTVRTAEVLLRLADSEELVMPSRFLYVAERTGLMPQLDALVVRRSVELLSRLQERSPGFSLEVNLSGHSIGDTLIEHAITTALHDHAVDPQTLILEITETAAVADIEAARAFAERMTELGCKFALDDFGAGFGSFFYLKHLLFDYVKIDGEFITSCHRSDVDRSILRSVVGIAHDLGKKTDAEFVSEPAVLDVIRAEGVDLAQGYLVGEPMPFDNFVERFLR